MVQKVGLHPKRGNKITFCCVEGCSAQSHKGHAQRLNYTSFMKNKMSFLRELNMQPRLVCIKVVVFIELQRPPALLTKNQIN